MAAGLGVPASPPGPLGQRDSAALGLRAGGDGSASVTHGARRAPAMPAALRRCGRERLVAFRTGRSRAGPCGVPEQRAAVVPAPRNSGHMRRVLLPCSSRDSGGARACSDRCARSGHPGCEVTVVLALSHSVGFAYAFPFLFFPFCAYYQVVPKRFVCFQVIKFRFFWRSPQFYV